MKYTGTFDSAERPSRHYAVEITTKATGAARTLKLGRAAFATQMEAGGTIYAPAKYTAATVAILTEDYMMDLYSATAHGTKVVLREGTAVRWTGYATPNLYDMGFVNATEEMSLECIDALSSLQYIKYNTATKQVRPLSEILCKVVRAADAYKVVYVADNTRLPGSPTPLLDDLYISEECFFDDKDPGQTDEDVAWSMRDVLEEICRYAGVTAVAHGDEVWLVDYDALRAGSPAYVAYSLDGAERTAPTVSPHHIVGSDYAGAGASISLDSVYNKATVSCDMRTYDAMLPDLFDDAALINITADAAATVNVDQRKFGNVSWTVGGKGGVMETLIDTGQTGRKKDGGFFVCNQYLAHPQFTPYVWTASGNASAPVATPLDRWDRVQQAFNGCVLKREFVRALDGNEYKSWGNLTGEAYIKRATDTIATVSFTDSIFCCVRGGAAPWGWATLSGTSPYDLNYSKYPIFDLEGVSEPRFFGGDNAYLLITGAVVLGHNDDDAYDKGSFEFSGSYKTEIPAHSEYIWCRLQWGEQYWNGEQWQATACDFKLYFDTPSDKPLKGNLYKALNIRNTVKWWWGLDQEGCAIPVPSGNVLSGSPKFRMYSPCPQYDLARYYSGQDDGRSFFIWIRDFAIEAVIGDPTHSGDLDSDTVYTNEINSDYVAELDEVKFKICTWDNKKPTFSAVAKKTLTGYKYTDATTNTACAPGEATWSGHSGKASLRQEEHMLYRLVNQYSTPSVILTLPLRPGYHPAGTYTDKTIGGKVFIVDTQSVDYAEGVATIRFVEKK